MPARAGRPRPTGKLETLQADAIVLALGQKTESEFLRGIPGVDVAEDGTVKVDAGMMTGHPGIFAGGDMVIHRQRGRLAIRHKRAKRARKLRKAAEQLGRVWTPRHLPWIDPLRRTHGPHPEQRNR